MKKTTILFLFFLLLKAPVSFAQVPNPGFENLNSDGSIRNWGSLYLFAVVIDSNGVGTTVDSIVFDQAFYAPTMDAHNGNTAMELRNAWNFTSNSGIAGRVIADTDSVFSGFGSFQNILVNVQPVDLGFYYKYFPVNNDTGMAHLQVWDSGSNLLGEAIIYLSGTVSNYTYISTPVVYTFPGIAASINLDFNTSIPGGSISFGTRLLIDDITMNTTNGINQVNEVEGITIYPNPANSEIKIGLAENVNSEINILNTLGECLLTKYNQNMINISELPNGIYIVKIITENKYYTEKLVKQ